MKKPAFQTIRKQSNSSAFSVLSRFILPTTYKLLPTKNGFTRLNFSTKNFGGFTAVELLITLFIAAAFLTSGYQLYSLIIKDGGETRMQARASNIAYDYLQRYKANVTNPCTEQAPETDSSIEVDGLSNSTVSVSITCPYVSTNTECTGGTITHDGLYTVHKFTTVGADTLTCTSDYSAEVLIVGGGGGGSSGGGGAGGYLNWTEALTGSMALTVGDGGAGKSQASISGDSGGDSSFGSRTGDTAAKGGGGGGKDAVNGGTGGSGGGGGFDGMDSTLHGLGTAGQGNNGGDNNGYISSPYASGGGGGQNTAGSNASSSTASGNGGSGVNSDIVLRGSYVGYAGGGGGGTYLAAGGGTAGTATHGGGAGNTDAGNGTGGTANTGGGGGGAGNGRIGGSGGSGIVIVRYLTPTTITTNSSISKILVTVKYNTPQQTVSNATYATVVSVPDAPTTLIATSGVSQVILNWVAPVNDGGSTITGYNIYKGTSSEGESLLATVGNVLTYTSKGLTSETTYYYKVTAINSEGEGAYSNEASAIASTGSSCLAILNATESTGDGVYWIKPVATRFQVYCDMTTSGGGWVLVMQIAAAQSTTFGYHSSYWTSANTLNGTVPSSLSSIDAKYDTFNTFVTSVGDLLLKAKNNSNYSTLSIPSMAGNTLLNRFTTLGGGISGTSPGTVLVAIGSQSPQELMGYSAPTAMCSTNPAKWRINFQNSHAGARLGNDVGTNDQTTNNASSWPCYNGEGSNLSYSGVGGTLESGDQWQDSYGSEALNRYRDNAGTGQGSHRGVSIFVRQFHKYQFLINFRIVFKHNSCSVF